MSEIRSGAILNYINLFISIGVGFFLSPFVLSSLGKIEYGIYTIAGSIISWLALCDFGLSASTTKFLSEYQAKGDKLGEAHYLGNVAALFSIIGCFVLVTGLAIYPFLQHIFPKFNAEQLSLYRILYLMTLLNTAVMFPAKSLGGISASRQKFTTPGIIGTVMSLISTIGTIIILSLGYKSIALCSVNILCGILGMLWNIYYCFGVLKARISWNGWDIPLCKSMFTFSFWMFLNQLINIMNTGASNAIIGMTHGPEQITVYSYGLNLFNYFAMLSSCISSLFLPKVVTMISRNASCREQTDLMIQVGRIHLLILLVAYLGIILFGKEFFDLWVGKTLGNQTYDSWIIAVIITVPYGIALLQCLGWQILQARNAMKYRVKVLTVSSLLSLLVGCTLSLNFGIIYMAIGTALSLIIGQGFFMNWYYSRRLGLEISRFFKQTLSKWWIWLPSLTVIGIILNNIFTNHSWITFIIKIIIFSISYFLIMFNFYATQKEKKSLFPFLCSK